MTVIEPDPKPKPETGKTEPTDAEKAQAEIDKWKALARKNEQQAKENAEAAKKLAGIEDANKSEIEKAAQRATDAEKRAADADLKVLRLEVAASKGLSAAQAKRLVGTTTEELQADADEILESFKPADAKSEPVPGKPTTDLKGGGDPTEEPDVNVREVIESIPRGF